MSRLPRAFAAGIHKVGVWMRAQPRILTSIALLDTSAWAFLYAFVNNALSTEILCVSPVMHCHSMFEQKAALKNTHILVILILHV